MHTVTRMTLAVLTAFALVAALMAGLATAQSEPEASFEDVPTTYRENQEDPGADHRAVETLRDWGVVDQDGFGNKKGGPGNEFFPAKDISRSTVARYIVEAIRYNNENHVSTEADIDAAIDAKLAELTDCPEGHELAKAEIEAKVFADTDGTSTLVGTYLSDGAEVGASDPVVAVVCIPDNLRTSDAG